ncbi:MAG: saccharopine dehydrogenase C-terminal domain-containing protein, partial [Ferruginibacter sp.]
SADILQWLVETKLKMLPADKDMIVMLHEFEYVQDNQQKSLKSCLVVKGEDSLRTAMAKTVGLPLGIAAKLILNETIKLKGLHIPTVKAIYMPVLKELETAGIHFEETSF